MQYFSDLRQTAQELIRLLTAGGMPEDTTIQPSNMVSTEYLLIQLYRDHIRLSQRLMRVAL